MLCLCPGTNPGGESLFGLSCPAATFIRVNRNDKTPCKSSKGTNDRKIALALRDSFLPNDNFKKINKLLL